MIAHTVSSLSKRAGISVRASRAPVHAGACCTLNTPQCSSVLPSSSVIWLLVVRLVSTWMHYVRAPLHAVHARPPFPYLTTAAVLNAAGEYYGDRAGKKLHTHLNSLAENGPAPPAVLVHMHNGRTWTEACEYDRSGPYPPVPGPGLPPAAQASSPPPPDDSWPPPLDPPSHPELSTADVRHRPYAPNPHPCASPTRTPPARPITSLTGYPRALQAIKVRWGSKITALQPAGLGLADVGSLRRHLAAGYDLPPSQLRLQSGSSELLDDGESLSAVNALVHAMERGGLLGGMIVPESRRRRRPASPSSSPSLRQRPSSGVDPPTQPAAVSGDATAALQAAIERFSGKGKVSDLHFPALTEATRVLCEPLTADSDLCAIGEACKVLGVGIAALLEDVETQRGAASLKAELDYPSLELKKAFKAHLRAEAEQADGGLVGKAIEAELAARRGVIAYALIKPADNDVPGAHVKMKDLFRRIRAECPDAWVASCGSLLEKADAALEETEAGKRRRVPEAVIDKWQAALVACGVSCKFKQITHLSGASGGNQHSIKGWHIIKFQLAGASTYPMYPTYPTYPTSAAPHQRTPRTPRTPPQVRLTWWRAQTFRRSPRSSRAYARSLARSTAAQLGRAPASHFAVGMPITALSRLAAVVTRDT